MTGRCGTTPVAPGAPAVTQIAGDCKQTVCDEQGAPSEAADDKDVLDDGKECTIDTCEAGSAVNTNAAAGVPCPATPGKYCNGAGSCVECTGDAQCMGGKCSPAGTCVPLSCGDGVKNGSETGVDCGGPTCGDCGVGQPCGAASDCQSGFCADGFCCNTACNGECVACSGAKTGASNGACAPIPANQDPDNECNPQAASTCGNSTGQCNGAGSCQKYPQGLPCGDVASCINGVQKNPDACSGTGTCDDGGAVICGLYACGAVACKTTCGSDADCGPMAHCSGTACIGKQLNGGFCGGPAECQSGFCVDGVCCNTACGGGAAGDCQACNLVGSFGLCAPVAAGTMCRASIGVCDPAEACNGSSMACPNDVFSPAGTQCRPSNGPCDVAESCTGNSPVCPSDALKPAGTQCRTASGACDAAESCTGNAVSCPPDALAPAGTPCGQGHACDGSGTCCDSLLGTHGLAPATQSAYTYYMFHDGWCGVGTVLPTQCVQGNYTYYQQSGSQTPISPGSNGSYNDPDAVWYVTCYASVDCVYDCSGACVPTSC